jgi:hypothetical protein
VISARLRSGATDAIHVAGRAGNRLVRRAAARACGGIRSKRTSAVGPPAMRGRGGSRRASRSVSMRSRGGHVGLGVGGRAGTSVRRLDTHVGLGVSVRSG